MSVGLQVVGPEGLPGRRVAGSRRVLSLEGLVASVVGRAFGEVSTPRGLHYPVDEQPGHFEGVDASLVKEGTGVDDPLAAHEGAGRGLGEQVVKVEVGSEELAVA